MWKKKISRMGRMSKGGNWIHDVHRSDEARCPVWSLMLVHNDRSHRASMGYVVAQDEQ